MVEHMNKYKKLAKKTGLTEEGVIELLAYDNLLDKHYKKKDLVNIEVRLEDDVVDHINKIRKTLKVSDAAIIGVAAMNYIKLKEESK